MVNDNLSTVSCIIIGLLTAACRMYLHGNYLCIPNGLTFAFFLNPGEALGPRIPSRLLEDAEKV